MKKSLIFLESSTKKITIKSFLGNDYEIFATGGHLWELKKTGVYNLGVDLEKFTPEYEIIEGKKKFISFWQNYLKQNPQLTIYLATDPDREGEAIAREVAEILKIPANRYKRLLFHEITAKSIRQSLENPLTLDKNLVDAQISRQVLDRMIGFCLSTLLQKKTKAPSAGRVQSVVLKMIVEREAEVKSYDKKKDYIICATYKKGKEEYILRQKTATGELVIYENEEKAEIIRQKLSEDFQLIKQNEEETFIFPKLPLITSLLLYEARMQLGFSIAKTTKLAQELYEGVWVEGKKQRLSLITYPRTDSSRLNKDFLRQTWQYITEKWGKNYCNFSTASPKEKKTNIQDAHEAIHPTYLNFSPSDLETSLNKEQQNLYNLIFNHTLTSLMSPARITRHNYNFINNKYYFSMKESIVKFFGFFIVNPTDCFSRYKVKEKFLLEAKDLNPLHTEKIEVKEYVEKKPRRYNEGSLVQELEKLGIGRPSTYNAFSKILLQRTYVAFDEKECFIPTELGLKVNQWLQENFSFLINENYTASLEEDLDEISQGKESYFSFIKRFWDNFFPYYKTIEAK